MPVYEESRYQTATLIIDVLIDEDGRETEVNSYLDSDRKIWRAEDFNDNQTVLTLSGETPDMLANRLYGKSEAYWIVCDFNDWVGEDPFIVFDGTEVLVMPSIQSVNNVILSGGLTE